MPELNQPAIVGVVCEGMGSKSVRNRSREGKTSDCKDHEASEHRLIISAAGSDGLSGRWKLVPHVSTELFLRHTSVICGAGAWAAMK